jgi:hypothetical protein
MLAYTEVGHPVSYEGSWAQALNAQGISVVAMDNQVRLSSGKTEV